MLTLVLFTSDRGSRIDSRHNHELMTRVVWEILSYVLRLWCFKISEHNPILAEIRKIIEKASPTDAESFQISIFDPSPKSRIANWNYAICLVYIE